MGKGWKQITLLSSYAGNHGEGKAARGVTPEEQEMEVAHSGDSAACEVLRTEVLREDDLRLRPVLMDVPRFHDDSGSLRDEEHLDCLSSMFNFDGDYLQYLFVAVLQSELPPDEIPPTVHNLSHVALSIVLHGCAATYNAYNQESKYRIPKRLCGRNGKPTTTTQIRLVVHNVVSLFSLIKNRKEGDYKLYSLLK